MPLKMQDNKIARGAVTRIVKYLGLVASNDSLSDVLQCCSGVDESEELQKSWIEIRQHVNEFLSDRGCRKFMVDDNEEEAFCTNLRSLEAVARALEGLADGCRLPDQTIDWVLQSAKRNGGMVQDKSYSKNADFHQDRRCLRNQALKELMLVNIEDFISLLKRKVRHVVKERDRKNKKQQQRGGKRRTCADTDSASGGEDSEKMCDFVRRLLALLDSNQEVIQWNGENTFTINPTHPRFMQVMKLQFKTDKFSSFQRQLHIYGFSKSTVARRGKGSRVDVVEFHHRHNLFWRPETDGARRSLAKIRSTRGRHSLQNIVLSPPPSPPSHSYSPECTPEPPSSPERASSPGLDDTLSTQSGDHSDATPFECGMDVSPLQASLDCTFAAQPDIVPLPVQHASSIRYPHPDTMFGSFQSLPVSQGVVNRPPMDGRDVKDSVTYMHMDNCTSCMRAPSFESEPLQGLLGSLDDHSQIVLGSLDDHSQIDSMDNGADYFLC